jgi:hypothetical protein
MQTRRRTGQYKSHHTPGDGTGFDKLPTKEDPTDILTDAHLAPRNGNEARSPAQPYDCQVTTDEKE